MAKKLNDRAVVLYLAADTGLDPRTVKRAVTEGLKCVRAEVDREKLQKAAKKLGIVIV